MKAKEIRFLDLLNGKVQYLVPRWQRRYRWGETEIRRLLEDMLAIADAENPARPHYGGTIITVLERSGVVKLHRVVDGQQRLTTVSILLACIAETLGDRKCGELTSQGIELDLLTNPKRQEDRRRKLRLQDGDEKDYRRIIERDSAGSGDGAVAKAWRIVRRIVDTGNVEPLIKGLHRLRVITIALENRDDAQQIFESLNATGAPLTEGEKVKNWLLMGLSEEVQQELHDEHWLAIERALGACREALRIDDFLRDVMRWRTGTPVQRHETYDEFRRWAIRKGRDNPKRRPELCSELASLATLYGQLTGTRADQSSRDVERILGHLRAMGIDAHRPFTLRLLCDAQRGESSREKTSLVPALNAVSSWITRAWLADRSFTGLGSAFAKLAHAEASADERRAAQVWIGRIAEIQDGRTSVPSDSEVSEGVRLASKYGGRNTRATKAVLCAIMDREQRGEAPRRDSLVVEHIMPQKLNRDWHRDLGGRANEIHERFIHRFGNLTLCGDGWNSALSNHSFDKKKGLYEKSSVLMTRRLADLPTWDETAMERRAGELTRKALALWPWSAPD